jgi:uncharacterized protein YraI
MDKPTPRKKQTKLATILLLLTAGVLVIVGLLLPPVSLGQRLMKSGYDRLDAKNPAVSHPDGLTIRADPALLSTALRLKVGSVPRIEFTPQSAPGDWREAASAIPSYLVLKSPVFTLDLPDGVTTPLQAEIATPSDAERDVLLDVYVWDGSRWHWTPRTLAAGKVLTSLSGQPQAVALMGASAQTPIVGVNLNPGEVLPSEIADLVTELYSAGVSLGEGGILLAETLSDVDEGEAYREFLTASATDMGPLQQLLADEAARQAHVQALSDLAIRRGYDGVNLNYRGVSPAQAEGFTRLVAGLAERLQPAGLQLVVTVPAPIRGAGWWETAGYQWTALAAHADRLLVDLPLDPDAYIAGGTVDQLLNWAITQVNRYQLLAGINALGVQKIGEEYEPVDVSEALSVLNSALARTDGGGEELAPGSEVVVELVGGTLVEDLAAGTYRIDTAIDGRQVTAWLPDEAALTKKLWVLNGYHLGGVVLDGLAGSEMGGELAAAVRSFFLAAKEIPLETTGTLLAWAVQDEAGEAVDQAVGDLSHPRFAWPAADSPGTYTIRGQLAIGQQVADLGAVQVVVRAPTPTPTETPEATATPVEVAEAEAEATPVPTFGADAVVSAELLNVRQGPDTAFARVDQLAQGTALRVLAANPNGTWIRIRTADGTEGWVFAAYCTLNIQLSDLPVEEVALPTPAPTPEGGVAPPPVAPPSGRGGFELGGQVNGHASRPDLMGQAGMNWIKLQAHHGQDMSGAIGGAHGQGFKILLSVIGDKSQVMNDSYQQSYAAYVGQLAAQGANAIEIWNEANLDREWPRNQIDPAAYTRLLAYSYNAIKRSNAGTIVIGGAPAPTGAEAAFPGQVMNDDNWLRGVVNAGGLSYMDCVGVHYNEGTVSPTAWTGATQGDNYYTRYYGGMVNTYSNITGGARPLCFTELGYLSPEGYGALPGNFAWASNTTVAQQAQWLGEVVSLARGSGRVRLLIVFNVDFTQWYPDDPQAGYAIIRPGGSCPACATMGAAMGR